MPLDIERATEQAEKGHGCLVKAALDELGDPEARFAVLKQIESLNAERRTSDKDLPSLQVSWSTWYGQGTFTLHEKDESFFGKDVYSETYLGVLPKTSRHADCDP
jgi:hypothetical protein